MTNFIQQSARKLTVKLCICIVIAVDIVAQFGKITDEMDCIRAMFRKVRDCLTALFKQSLTNTPVSR